MEMIIPLRTSNEIIVVGNQAKYGKGTAFPTSPTPGTDDLWFRTDFRAWFQYDGAAWRQTSVGDFTGSFPASPTTSLRVRRVDRGLEYFYDGTRWITTAEYLLPLASTFTATSTTTLATIILPTTYAPYITTVTVSVRVDTTNSGGNVWTYAVEAFNDASTTADTIISASTVGIGTGTFATINHTSLTTPAPTNRSLFRVTASKGGTAGQLYLSASLSYRLIG